MVGTPASSRESGGVLGTPALETAGADTTATAYTAVTPGGGAHNKGAWVEVVASTAFAADGFYVVVPRMGSARSVALADVGIGGAGSESVLVANLLLGADTEFYANLVAYVPLPVAAGSRLSMRAQSNVGTAGVLRVALIMVAGSYFSLTPCVQATTYGAITAASNGVAPTPGATANTKGAWEEVVAAATNPLEGLLVCITQTGGINFSVTRSILADVGVGAPGSESVLVADLFTLAHANPDQPRPACYGPFPVTVAAGARLSVRTQCDLASEGANFSFVVVGFD